MQKVTGHAPEVLETGTLFQESFGLNCAFKASHQHAMTYLLATQWNKHETGAADQAQELFIQQILRSKTP